MTKFKVYVTETGIVSFHNLDTDYVVAMHTWAVDIYDKKDIQSVCNRFDEYGSYEQSMADFVLYPEQTIFLGEYNA